MAVQGSPIFHTRKQDQIKENEREINDLKKQVRTLQEQLKDHEENCQPKIKELEEEIKRLKKEINRLEEENRTLRTEIRDLKESNTFLENEMESVKQTNEDMKKQLRSTTKQLKDHDGKIKEFELSEDELIIRQLCSSVQENILRFVLQEYYDEIQNKNIKDIQEYIKRQIGDKQQQQKSKSRWKKLKKEIKWDYFLIRQLKSVKQRGNITAHPPLTEERIDAAKMNLKEKKKLSENMVNGVDQLKTMWKQTRSKLLQGPLEKPTEVQDQSGSKNPSTYADAAKATGLSHITSDRESPNISLFVD